MSTAPAPLQAPPPPPRASSNWIWWLLGGAGALVVLVILSGLFIAGSFIRGVRVDQKRRQVEMRTPAGSLTVEKTDVRDVGLPVYPGSTPVESGGNVTWTTPGDDRVGIMAAHYRTADDMQKVDAWYRTHLGPEFERDAKSAGEGKIRVRGVTRGGVAYVSDHNDLVRFVAISKKAHGVEIALGRVGSQEPQ